MSDISITFRSERSDASRPNRLYLLVLRGARFDAYPLPRSGDVVVGRAPDCDVTIDDPSISRKHIVVHIGPPLALEDLDSANGTHVRDEAIAANTPVPIQFNEVIALGSVMIIIQQRTRPIRGQRIRNHDYFEGRLAEECGRAERQGTTFAVLRIRCLAPIPEPIIHDAFAEALRSVDIVGSYGPDEFEVLLADTPVKDDNPVVLRVSEELAKRGARVRMGVAFCPRDGRDADSLLAAAGAAARDETATTERAPIVCDPAMEHLYKLAERLAAGTISILIVGETGSGKELLAEKIHRSSPRSAKPLLRINCAAFSETLLASELFGHEKGAFTGATHSKPGLLETAEGGTVFLDEIGEMPMAAQVKLLRVMEEQEVLRVGGIKPRKIDVRFVAATNRVLEEEVECGSFREDLYYRIAGVTLAIPPLRHRLSEIEPLAKVFIDATHSELGRADRPVLTDAARELLMSYSWPGNIRELRNVMERAVLLSAGPTIDVEHLPTEKLTSSYTTRAKRPTRQHESVEDSAERKRVIDALEATGGNQTEAAKILGISRRTLGKRLEQYGIPRPRKRSD